MLCYKEYHHLLRVLQAILLCTRGHRKRNNFFFTKTKPIDLDKLKNDVDNLPFDFINDDCDNIINSYNCLLSNLLAKYAPVKTISVPSRDPNHWMTEEILSAKRKRKDERIWRKSQLTVHFETYCDSCMMVKKLISRAKET